MLDMLFFEWTSLAVPRFETVTDCILVGSLVYFFSSLFEQLDIFIGTSLVQRASQGKQPSRTAALGLHRAAISSKLPFGSRNSAVAAPTLWSLRVWDARVVFSRFGHDWQCGRIPGQQPTPARRPLPFLTLRRANPHSYPRPNHHQDLLRMDWCFCSARWATVPHRFRVRLRTNNDGSHVND